MMYCGENRPPTEEAPNTITLMNMSTSASRKLGVAMPMKAANETAVSPTEYWCVAE